MSSTLINGHHIRYNNVTGEWLYLNGDSIKDPRACPKCNRLPHADGRDACLPLLPGVKNACCGHGVDDGYIQFNDGTIIRFNLLKIELKI